MNNQDQDNIASTGRINYFNYFTEVEEEFVRRRGKSLLVSPMDWALIESWKSAGIPLHIVLRAINRAFDAYDARPRRYRRVNSVFYCQQEVEATYAEYRLSQVGSSTDKSEPRLEESREEKPQPNQRAPIFPKEVLMDFFARSDGELEGAEKLAEANNQSEIRDALQRARSRLKEIGQEVERTISSDAEAIEHDLDGIDRLLLDALKREAGQEGIAALRKEGESLLQAYRKKMDRSVYDQTINNFISRRLREMNQVPRLSLFYL